MSSRNSITNRCISIILGGGVGSRLYPLTKERSKPAVPIGGKYRLIDIPISNCLNSGIKRMYVLTQYNSASLNQHVKNTFRFDHFSDAFVEVLAAEQTKHNMEWFQGTADAVRQSLRNVTQNDFDHLMILSGDQLYHMDLERFLIEHEESGADVTIATIPVVASDATSFGIMKVAANKEISSFVEKPDMEELPNWKSEVEQKYKDKGKDYLASMGIYIFKKGVLSDMLKRYDDKDDFGKEIIPLFLKEGKKTCSFLYDGYWEDIGDIGSFYDSNIALTEPLPDFNLFDPHNVIFTRPRLLSPSKIWDTHIKSSIIAEGSILNADLIEKSVVGIRARIGDGTEIKFSYVMGNDYYENLDQINSSDNPMGIGDNCYIERAIIDKHVHIGNNVRIVGHPDLEEVQTEAYSIRKGIVVVNKGAVIPANTTIGME